MWVRGIKLSRAKGFCTLGVTASCLTVTLAARHTQWNERRIIEYPTRKAGVEINILHWIFPAICSVRVSLGSFALFLALFVSEGHKIEHVIFREFFHRLGILSHIPPSVSGAKPLLYGHRQKTKNKKERIIIEQFN